MSEDSSDSNPVQGMKGSGSASSKSPFEKIIAPAYPPIMVPTFNGYGFYQPNSLYFFNPMIGCGQASLFYQHCGGLYAPIEHEPALFGFKPVIGQNPTTLGVSNTDVLLPKTSIEQPKETKTGDIAMSNGDKKPTTDHPIKDENKPHFEKPLSRPPGACDQEATGPNYTKSTEDAKLLLQFSSSTMTLEEAAAAVKDAVAKGSVEKIRETMKVLIYLFLVSREKFQAWKPNEFNCLPKLANSMEQLLFTKAPSVEAYANTDTVKARILRIARGIRDKANNSFIQEELDSIEDPFAYMRQPWHDPENDKRERESVFDICRVVLNQKEKFSPWKAKEKKSIPVLARLIEQVLYGTARNHSEYSDVSTIKSRIMCVSRRLNDIYRKRKRGDMSDPLVDTSSGNGTTKRKRSRAEASTDSDQASLHGS